MPSKSQETEESLEDKKDPVVEKPQEPVVKKTQSKGPIQVVALRAGFYGLVRRVEGDKFTIEGEHQLGDWMKKI